MNHKEREGRRGVANAGVALCRCHKRGVRIPRLSHNIRKNADTGVSSESH